MSSETAMRVERVETESSSHVEPPLEQDWSDLEKLRWHLGVLAADTGLEMKVSEVRPGRFCLSAAGHGWGDQTFFDAWHFINGISDGATLAAKTREQGRLAGLAEAVALIEAAADVVSDEWLPFYDLRPHRLASVLNVLKAGGVG